MSPEDVSDASDVASATTARLLRRLADIDAAVSPRVGGDAPRRRASARLRRAVKIVVSYDDRRVRIRFRRRSSRTRPGRWRFTSRGSRRIRTAAEEATAARALQGPPAAEARAKRASRVTLPRNRRAIPDASPWRSIGNSGTSSTPPTRRRRISRSRETRREHAPKTRARKRWTIVQTVRVTNGFAGRRRFCGKTSSSRAWIDRAPDHA